MYISIFNIHSLMIYTRKHLMFCKWKQDPDIGPCIGNPRWPRTDIIAYCVSTKTFFILKTTVIYLVAPCTCTWIFSTLKDFLFRKYLLCSYQKSSDFCKPDRAKQRIHIIPLHALTVQFTRAWSPGTLRGPRGQQHTPGRPWVFGQSAGRTVMYL